MQQRKYSAMHIKLEVNENACKGAVAGRRVGWEVIVLYFLTAF